MAASKRRGSKRRGSNYSKRTQTEFFKPTEASTPKSADYRLRVRVPIDSARPIPLLVAQRKVSRSRRISAGFLVMGLFVGMGVVIAWWYRSQQSYDVQPPSFEKGALVPIVGPLAQRSADSSKPLKAVVPGAGASQQGETHALATPRPTREASASRGADTSTPAKSAKKSSSGSAIASSRRYTIKPGDTFHSLAARLYGDGNSWFAIAEVNPDVDPGTLTVGQVIKLPDLQALKRLRERQWKALRRTMAKPGAAPRTTTVYPGDNLAMIAKRVYGDSSRWRLIYEVNRDRLVKPDDLKVGMKLTVHPFPTPANDN